MVTPSLPGTLSPGRRARDLEDVAGGAVDVVVVGGGVTGAGVALDAVSRGLSVALLERTDLAAGTSRWSSKLVHGGLRYLAHGEIGLARESARERAVLMGSTAPHLVRRLPFLVPDVAGRDVTALAAAGGRLGDAVRLSVPGAAVPCRRRGGCRPTRWRDWSRVCGRAAAASSSGTGSSWTTPGWWSPSPGRPRPTGPGW
jgi:glycerol-3-phosphate dehydrogenase